MASEWRETSLGEEVDILLGFAFKSAQFSDTPPGHRLVRGDNVKRGCLEWGPTSRYWRHWSSELERYLLREGDVVIGMDGSRVGENFAVISKHDLPSLLVQRVACLRGHGRLDQGFLRYLVCNQLFTAYIKAVHTGTSIPHISGRQIGAYPVALPPIREQRGIAHILGTLDDKIELNRRMNETLEAMTRALFKSWLVDFDPVRAKAEGRDPGLPKHLADLFPDAFEDSEMGEIPKGWRVCFIRDLTSNIQYGFTQSASSDLVGPRFLRITDIQGGKVDWSTVPFCEVTPEEYERYRLKPGDVLVARTGASTGENIYLSYAPDAVFASYLVRFQFPDLANARLVGAFMRTQAYIEYVAGGIGGSAQPNASAQVLAGAQLVVPTPSIARMFSDLIVPFDLSVVANAHESRTLTALRDTLLPKLISGELRIEDAKRIIERATA